MTTHPVLCLGEALVDVVIRGPETSEHVGGSPLNVACGLAALDHPVVLASWWGDDQRGHAIAEYARSRHVDVCPGTDGAEKTTVAYALLDELGHATYEFDMEWNVPELPALSEISHIHIGSYSATVEPGGSAVHRAVAAMGEYGTVSYDPNVRPAVIGTPDDVRERIAELIALSDVVKASEEDVAWLYGERPLDDVMKEWLASGASLVVITRGGDGALAMLANEPDVMDVPPFAVPVADTVGAGDSFMGGLLSGLLDAGLIGGLEAKNRLRAATWSDVAPALERATATSNITVSHVGAYSPTREEVREILAEVA